jgi:hypothetical protein
VKASIQKTYRTSETFGDGQVVVITFDDGITFEILPVFDNSAGTWNHPDANNGGSWRVTNPRSEIEAIHTRNRATNGNLKALCRMMRVWKDHWAVPMSGLLVDTLAYQFIGSWPHGEKSFSYHGYLVRDFLNYISLQRVDQTHWRAPGSGAYVRGKGVFIHKARSAYLRALEAIDHLAKGHAWSSREKWREIFGPVYPQS